MVGHIKIQTTDKKYNTFTAGIYTHHVEFNNRKVSKANVVKVWDSRTGEVLFENADLTVKARPRTHVFHCSSIRETVKGNAISKLPDYDSDQPLPARYKRSKEVLVI